MYFFADAPQEKSVFMIFVTSLRRFSGSCHRAMAAFVRSSSSSAL